MSNPVNENTKPRYQLWSEDAFQGDSDVRYMTAVQRWMYRTLCQAAFFCTTRPYLPDDDDQLWKLAGCESRKRWMQNKQVVRAMFVPIIIDGQKLLSRKRIVEDWAKLQDFRQKQSDKGKKSAAARAHQSNHGSTTDEPRLTTAEPRSTNSSKGKVRLGKVEKKREEKLNLEPAPVLNGCVSPNERPGEDTNNPKDLFGDPVTSPDLTENQDGAGKEIKPPSRSVPKIGDIPTDSLDVMLTALSDGVFELGALANYTDQLPDLKIACAQVIDKHYSTPLLDRHVLITILNDLIDTLKAAGERYHPGLLKTVKRLQASDRKLQLKPQLPLRGMVFGDVFGKGLLGLWEKELSPYRALMQKLTLSDGVPQTPEQCDDFLGRGHL